MNVLMEFLSVPLSDGGAILERFAALPGAVYRQGPEELQRFVYVPGSRKDRVVLIAHVDTVWDRAYRPGFGEPLLRVEGNTVSSGMPGAGIGADDRAGCAMVWELRGSGHSLLLLDGEEKGHHGAWYLRKKCPWILWELNRHRYMVQLDLWGRGLCMYHRIPNSRAFCRYMETGLSLMPLDLNNGTDVSYLCRGACGINISVGYENFHRPGETLDLAAWKDMYERLSAFLAKPQPRFRTVLWLRTGRLRKRILNKIRKAGRH